jgi:hypothetical protein
MALLLVFLLSSTPVSFPSCHPGAKAGTLNCTTKSEDVHGSDVKDGEKTVTYKAPSGYILTGKGRNILERRGTVAIDSNLSKDHKSLTCRWKAKKTGKTGFRARVRGYCTATASKV